jgi:predicted nucleic acid-binding protein
VERLFVDTGAWFAFGNRRDPDHHRVRRALREFDGRLVTSNFVLDETVTLCRYRRGHSDAATVGRILQSGDVVDLIRVTADDERQAWALFLERSDQSYSYTDCTSFSLLRRLGIERVAALDDDFRSEGFTVLPD